MFACGARRISGRVGITGGTLAGLAARTHERKAQMNDGPMRRIIEDRYDDAGEDTLRSMVSDFYSRRLASTAILVWGAVTLFFALAAFSAFQFFQADRTKEQIMYATMFILGTQGIGLMKAFAWDMVHRHNIKREIKHLELRVAELSEAVKSRQV